MELLSSVSLSSYYSFTGRPSSSTSKDLFPSFAIVRNSKKNKSPAYAGLKLCTVKLRPFSLTATAVDGHATNIPCESGTDRMPDKQSYPRANPGSGEEKNDDSEDNAMVRVNDKLIEVFSVDITSPTEWRRMLAFSREWNTLRPHFFKRCKERAENEENPEMKLNLLRLGRKLKEIDKDVQRHNELLEVVRNRPSEIDNIISRRRKDFTEEFFSHVAAVAASYQDNPTERDAIIKTWRTCFAAVHAYEAASESIKEMKAAELKLKDIFNSPSVEAACRKIDNLANTNQIDAPMMSMITKAWSDTKETGMMEGEAKDIMYHLYLKYAHSLQRLLPREVRILKYLLRIKDPQMLLLELKNAFTPGLELEGEDVDWLYTTPQEMHTLIKKIIDHYHSSKDTSFMKEVAEAMTTVNFIRKLEEIEKLIQDKFM